MPQLHYPIRNFTVNSIPKCDRCKAQLTQLLNNEWICAVCGSLYDSICKNFIAAVDIVKYTEEIKHKADADQVKNPSHYCIAGYECSKVAEAIGLVENAYLFNIFKYIWRARHKGNEKQDLEKIIQYAKMRIAQLEKQNAIQES